MAILLCCSNQKKVFNKPTIIIGSTKECDFVVNIGNEKLILQYSQAKGKYILVNKFANPMILFKGNNVSSPLIVDNVLKLTVKNSTEYIVFKVVELPVAQTVATAKEQEVVSVKQSAPTVAQVTKNEDTALNQISQDSVVLHSPSVQQSQDEIEKSQLEAQRSSVIKQVGFAINDIKNRLSLNNKTSVFMHIALLFSSFVTAFGVSNFITGLKIEETSNFINLPTNIKVLVIFTILVYGICLTLKQGIFLHYQSAKFPKSGKTNAQTFLLSISTVFFIGLYAINLAYYIHINIGFAILMSLFFVGLSAILSSICGYYKCTGHAMAYELDKYEYREDFEVIMNNYRRWIDKYINSFTDAKIEKLKDKLFFLQIKSVGETILGLFTAPFLAYGVSNTLAMCFPEAAGWISVSGIRFSPVFLVLATCLIIFAFFSFVNAFLNIRKVQASQVIKHDGFCDYLSHGVEIYGIQAVRRLESEKIRSLCIGCAIIFIEFTMNMSFFATEIGGNLQGLLLSVIAALLPTALLIAETYMLSQTKFDICAIDDLLTKKD